MSEILDNLPWRKIQDYLAQIGAAKSKSHFLAVLLATLLQLVPFDVEGGFFEVMGSPLQTVGASEKRVRAYIDYYQFRQPFLDEMEGNLLPAHLLGAQITDWTTRYRDTEMVTDFMVPGGIRKTLTSVLPENRFVLALHRSRFVSPFSELDRATMNVVAPHIKNLYSIWEKVDHQTQIALSAEAIADSLPRLSAREAEISALLCTGLTANEIASKLFISRRTVDAHTAHIYDKLDVRRRGLLKQTILNALAHQNYPN